MSRWPELTDELRGVLEVVRELPGADAMAVAVRLGERHDVVSKRLRRGARMHYLSAVFIGNRYYAYTLTPQGEAVLPQSGTRGPRFATPRTIPFSGVYDGAELRPITVRNGSQDALRLPSRFGEHLTYRRGA